MNKPRPLSRPKGLLPWKTFGGFLRKLYGEGRMLVASGKQGDNSFGLSNGNYLLAVDLAFTLGLITPDKMIAWPELQDRGLRADFLEDCLKHFCARTLGIPEFKRATRSEVIDALILHLDRLPPHSSQDSIKPEELYDRIHEILAADPKRQIRRKPPVTAVLVQSQFMDSLTADSLSCGFHYHADIYFSTEESARAFRAKLMLLWRLETSSRQEIA